MDKVILILVVLISFKSFGQVVNNRHDRLTKDEFAELRKHRNLFVPADLKNDTVIIVQYSPEKLAQMINTARNISFVRNGADTTGLKNESWLTAKQMERNKRMLTKFSNEYPEDLKRELKKKGINCTIVNEEALQDNERFRRKYWLKTIYISTQKSLEDNGWVLSYTNFFYDAGNGTDYETFLPMNHNLLELVE